MRGREDKRGDTTATKTVKGEVTGVAEEGDSIVGALVAATPTLNKGATTVDDSATTEPA